MEAKSRCNGDKRDPGYARGSVLARVYTVMLDEFPEHEWHPPKTDLKLDSVPAAFRQAHPELAEEIREAAEERPTKRRRTAEVFYLPADASEAAEDFAKWSNTFHDDLGTIATLRQQLAEAIKVAKAHRTFADICRDHIPRTERPDPLPKVEDE